jgi:methylase of polypeptide subunit release factors
MSDTSDDLPLRSASLDGLRRIREHLNGVGYTEEAIGSRFRTDDLGALYRSAAHSSALSAVLYRTRGLSSLDVLTRLFLAGAPVDRASVREALGPTDPSIWVDAGLLRIEGDAVSATVRLRPYRGLVLAHDSRTIERADEVVGVGGSTIALARMAVRRPSRVTLDLGTGCGVLGLVAAQRSERVVATDRSPRAIAFAEFNARLNGLSDRIDLRTGDLLEPARGHAYGAIISNLPFVLSPGVRYVYRDTGDGENLPVKVAREAAPLLEEGGYCQFFCQWAHHAFSLDSEERLRGWFEGNGCDVWVMCKGTLDVPSYVQHWMRSQGSPSGDFGFDEWTSYFDERDIVGISLGLVTLRRASGRATWFRSDDAPELEGDCGDAILRGFELRDFLDATRDDAALLDARLRPSPHLRITQQRSPSAEGWTSSEKSLRLVQGLCYTGDLRKEVADVIERFHTERRVSDVVDDLARSQETSRESIAAGCLRAVRALVARDALWPAGLPSAPTSTIPGS